MKNQCNKCERFKECTIITNENKVIFICKKCKKRLYINNLIIKDLF